jgi:hypothetical protein
LSRENKLAILCALVMAVGLPYLYVRDKPEREKRAQEERIKQRETEAFRRDLDACPKLTWSKEKNDFANEREVDACTNQAIDNTPAWKSFEKLEKSFENQNPDVISEGPKKPR